MKDAILDPKGTAKLPQKGLDVNEYQPTPEDGTMPQSKKKRKRKPEEVDDSVGFPLYISFGLVLYTQCQTPKSSNIKLPRAPKPVDSAKALKVRFVTLSRS